MWRWHAIEEIEHKGVAYDTWRHATRTMPRGLRWSLRALAMMRAAVRFHWVIFRNTADLLAQDGRNDLATWRRRLHYLSGYPGAKIRRASCRESGWQYGALLVVAVSMK